MINVLVTAIGGGGHGDQVLKALRLAAPGRYRIFGTDMRGDVAQRQLVDEFATLPAAESPEYVPYVLELCEAWGIKALFHGCEQEMLTISNARDAFLQAGVLLPMNSRDLIDLCSDKVQLNDRLHDLGFDPPKGIALSDPVDADLVDSFPVIVKPSVGGGGSANVYIAQCKKELLALVSYLSFDKSIKSLVAQEYVGDPASEFTIGVLHDLDGGFVDAIALNRELGSTLSVRARVPNRTTKHALGSTLVVSSGVSQGQIGKFSEITNEARRLADALGSKGPLNIQCRVVDGHLKVFEINPRYSGTTSLRALMGFNEPDLMLRRHILGEDIPRDRAWPSRIITRTLSENVGAGGSPT